MSEYEPTEPDGAVFHTCPTCTGEGIIGEVEEGEVCPECDGVGEWFE